MLNIESKTVVITGGGSGIGASMVKCFAGRGARVVILELDLDKANQLVSEIGYSDNRITCHQVDVANQSLVLQVMQRIIDDQGSIDILINNAGISQVGSLDKTTEQDFDRVFNVNVKGVYNCLLGVIEHMKSKRSGVILNMCSVAATVGLKDRFAYSATKGAIRSITFSVAKDYLPYNIRCNSISPARVHTPFVDDYLKKNYPGREQEIFEQLASSQPIGRMAAPEEIANLALYLCSEEASFITGTDYPIDGGFIKLNT
ncbi:MAG: oxidoreductase [Cyclobacteriaceae bacterium]|nr:MAG: oxidoreductase [Cyclobacteriaceae bacterium]